MSKISLNNQISHTLPANERGQLSAELIKKRMQTRFDHQIELVNGRYIIEQKITVGGCAEVYLATDTKKNHLVALKVFGDSKLLGQDNWNICRTEARLHDRISTTRSVKAHDYHICKHGGGEIFILSMEYLDGITFRKWLENNKNNPDIRHNEGLAWFHKMCLCVQDIHHSAFSHLDIKPENFLLVGNDVKVIDFGTAAFITVLNEEPDNYCQQVPATPAYMAPELFTLSYANDITKAADIYSLGIVLYELLSPDGRPPFDGDHDRLRTLHTNMGIGPEHLNKIDEKYRPLLAKCLHRDPLHRFQNVSDLIDFLNDITPETSDSDKDINDYSLVELIKKLDRKTLDNPLLPSENSNEPSFRKLTADAVSALKDFQWDKAVGLLRLAQQSHPGDVITSRTIGLLEEFLASVQTQRLYIENHIAAHDFEAALNKTKQLENHVSQLSELRTKGCLS